jgi:hypothetical protein
MSQEEIDRQRLLDALVADGKNRGFSNEVQVRDRDQNRAEE